MVGIARKRVADLFSLAEREAFGGHLELADRYVSLARQVGMRYNVRLLSEYRELYCRRCSAFWVEGRTVRTRLRAGRRVRTCINCGARRQVRVKLPKQGPRPPPWSSPGPAHREEGALAVGLPGEEEGDTSDEESEDE